MSDAPLVVVAGATGYIGSHAAVAFARAGFRVRALARNPDKLAPIRAAISEVFVGEATCPETLEGLCDGAFAVFSSIGLRSASRTPTFWTVDRDANLHLVAAAEAAGAERFIFVSAIGGEVARAEVPLAEAREQVVDRLGESPLTATVLRPTGLFNDLAGMFEMARRGRFWLVGDGRARINPVHAMDVADQALAALQAATPAASIEIGGPDVFTFRELGALAFDVLDRPPRFGRAPLWLLRVVGWLVRPFNVNVAAILAGIRWGCEAGAVAPQVGHRTLAATFRVLASPEADRALLPEVAQAPGPTSPTRSEGR